MLAARGAGRAAPRRRGEAAAARHAASCWGSSPASRCGRTSCRRAPWPRRASGSFAALARTAARSSLWALVPLVAASAPCGSRGRARRAGHAHRASVRAGSESTLAHLGRVAAAPARAAGRRPRHPRAGGRGLARTSCSTRRAGRPGLLVLLYGFLLVLAGRAALAAGTRPCSCFLAAGLALLAFPFPVRAAPAHHPLPDPALPARGRARGVGAPRRAAPRAAAGSRSWPSPPAPHRRRRSCSRPGAASTAPRRRSCCPTCGPSAACSRQHGVRHAYASYGPAFRLTWESGERIVASPPWNDRFRHWPLPLPRRGALREERGLGADPGDPDATCPRPTTSSATMRRLGGRWRRARGRSRRRLPRLRAALLARGSSPGRARGRRATATCARSSSPTPARRLRADACRSRAASTAVTLLVRARRAAPAAQRRRRGERGRQHVRDGRLAAGGARSGSTCAG